MRRAVVLLLLLPAVLGAFYEWGGPAGRGVRQLKARQYDAAQRSLRESRADFPGSAALRYDEALALAGVGFPDSAAEIYGQAHALEGARARAAAAYNRGNLALRAKRYPEAAAWYRNALRLEPDAQDAKRNLEEALRRMRSEGPPPPPASGAGQGSTGQRQEPGARSPAGGPPSAGSGTAPEPMVRPPADRHGFTRPEAERWLEALERERRAGRRAPAHTESGQPRRDRDW